jgi:hypothetical protein
VQKVKLLTPTKFQEADFHIKQVAFCHFRLPPSAKIRAHEGATLAGRWRIPSAKYAVFER